MVTIPRLITHSDCLEELDLEDNLVGDLGGYEILQALKDRDEGNHLVEYHDITLAPWSLKSPATRLFVKTLVRANNKET